MQDDGSTETILKYYSFAGGMVAMHDGTSLKYFLTDHLSSVIAVLDASGNLLSEQRYHARFYFNPNAITMAGGDIFDLFQGYTDSTNVFRIQVQKSGGMYQVRIGARNDAGTWTDSAWQDLTAGWNALEVDWQAAHSTGSLRLWVGGTLKVTLSAIDNDGSKIDSVRLGAQGVDTGTRGTIYFDDFESRRFSEIGLLPDPGMPNSTPDPISGWDNVSYTYGDPKHVHAVTGLSNGSTYTYDSNGNQICRVENSQTFVQIYNAENRFAGAMLVSGTCASPGTTLATWVFTYDGDGTRVKQVYTDGSGTLTTYYFFGGAYEVQDDGSTETVLKYYSFAGGMVAMHDGTSLKYFLTDHLSSVMAVLDASGNLLSEQRYLPFGQVRDDVGTIDETDFGYTSQRTLDAQGTAYALGLMDYRARFYSPYITHFTQPDTIVPELANPQTWNRYSYVLNSPLQYIDPSGHVFCDEYGNCHDHGEEYQGDSLEKYLASPFPSGFVITGGYDADNSDRVVHLGLDLRAADWTQPIFASTTGSVIVNDPCTESYNNCKGLDKEYRNVADANFGYGNVLVIEIPLSALALTPTLIATINSELPKDVSLTSDMSLYVLYAHFKEPPLIDIGNSVEGGTFLGTMGNVGVGEKIHLHITTRIDPSGKISTNGTYDNYTFNHSWINDFYVINPLFIFGPGE